uniref:Profilin n=1 Tax=Panagrellus redivivus TaxID=6233 RepID=A0A7E4ZYV7_PANRE
MKRFHIPEELTNLQKDIVKTVCAIRTTEFASEDGKGTVQPHTILFPTLDHWEEFVLTDFILNNKAIKKAAIVSLDGSIWASTSTSVNRASKAELQKLIIEFDITDEQSSSNINYEKGIFVIFSQKKNTILALIHGMCVIKLTSIIIAAIYKSNSPSAYLHVTNVANELAEKGY